MTREFSYRECLELEVTIAGEVEPGPSVYGLTVVLSGNGRCIVLNDFLDPAVMKAIKEAALDRWERERNEHDQLERDAHIERKIDTCREER